MRFGSSTVRRSLHLKTKVPGGVLSSVRYVERVLVGLFMRFRCSSVRRTLHLMFRVAGRVISSVRYAGEHP